MNNPLVSIIIPTYNAEKYISECLDSVIAQTYANIEIIIIVDGSPDSSLSIAKEYEAKDQRIKVYWQENAGAGPARNNGISKSTGEFIMFVDPDDWILPDYVEKHVHVQQEGDYDMVGSSREDYYFSKEGNIVKQVNYPALNCTFITIDEIRANFELLYVKKLISGPVFKLYRSSIIKGNNVDFPPLRRSQDIAFNIKLYNFYTKIKFFEYYGYKVRFVWSEKLMRVRSDHRIAIKYIYEAIEENYRSWGMPFIKTTVSTNYLDVINLICETIVVRKDDDQLVETMNDKLIVQIIKDAQPHSLHSKVMRSIYLTNNILLIKAVVLLYHILKSRRVS